MGWLFTSGSTRKEQIRDRTEDWQRIEGDVTIKSRCLAHCYRGGAFSGVLWSVWERVYERSGEVVQPTMRWIACDLLRYRSGFGWGYKDMAESMGPGYYSCPLKYLEMVPLDQFGGNEDWRSRVRDYHARQQEARAARRQARLDRAFLAAA